MAKTCINCHKTFEGKFCNHCGQKGDSERLTFHSVWHDLQHGLLHFDKGIFFTIKELFSRPGHSIREYIEGKRVKHFKPISLVIVLATIYGFLFHYFHINVFSTEQGDSNAIDIFKGKLNELVGSKYFLIELFYCMFYQDQYSTAHVYW